VNKGKEFQSRQADRIPLAAGTPTTTHREQLLHSHHLSMLHHHHHRRHPASTCLTVVMMMINGIVPIRSVDEFIQTEFVLAELKLVYL